MYFVLLSFRHESMDGEGLAGGHADIFCIIRRCWNEGLGIM